MGGILGTASHRCFAFKNELSSGLNGTPWWILVSVSATMRDRRRFPFLYGSLKLLNLLLVGILSSEWPSCQSPNFESKTQRQSKHSETNAKVANSIRLRCQHQRRPPNACSTNTTTCSNTTNWLARNKKRKSERIKSASMTNLFCPSCEVPLFFTKHTTEARARKVLLVACPKQTSFEMEASRLQRRKIFRGMKVVGKKNLNPRKEKNISLFESSSMIGIL